VLIDHFIATFAAEDMRTFGALHYVLADVSAATCCICICYVNEKAQLDLHDYQQ
jgi:hypothetical protein